MKNTEEQQLSEQISKLAKNIYDGIITYGNARVRGDIALPPSASVIEDELMSLLKSHESQIKQDIFKKVEGLPELEAEDINEVHTSFKPKFKEGELVRTYKTNPSSTAYDYAGGTVNGRNQLRAEFRSSLKALEEKEMGESKIV